MKRWVKRTKNTWTVQFTITSSTFLVLNNDKDSFILNILLKKLFFFLSDDKILSCLYFSFLFFSILFRCIITYWYSVFVKHFFHLPQRIVFAWIIRSYFHTPISSLCLTYTVKSKKKKIIFFQKIKILEHFREEKRTNTRWSLISQSTMTTN